MALNIQIQHYASIRLVKIVLGAVAILTILFAIITVNTFAMPGNVLTRLQAGVTSSNLSPNPASVLLYNANNGNAFGGSIFNPPGNSGVSSNHGHKHILKNEDTSNVRNTLLNVYYDTEAAAQSDTFALKQDYCNFSARNNSPPTNPDGNNSNPYPAGKNRHVAAFYVNGVAVVDAAGTAFRSAATPNGEATTCAHFDRSWPVMGTSVFDSTMGKYKNTLQFQLEGNRYQGGSQKVLFQVRSANGGSLSLATSTGSTDFGLDEQPGDKNSNLSVAAGLPFGLTCAYASPIQLNAPVELYDPDPTVFGESYLFIMKRAEPTPANPNPTWQKLNQNEYSSSSNVSRWDAGAEKWVIGSGVAPGVTTKVTIGEYRKDTDYLLVYDNPYQNGMAQPSGNVLSVGLPGESFSTMISCKFDLQPSVSQPNPDPVAPGEVLRVSGGVTNVGPVGGSPGNHTWNQYVAKFRQKPSLAEMDLPNSSAAFNPCDAIPSANRYACAKFSGDFTYPAQQVTGDLSYQTDASDLPGSYICFTTRVIDPTDDPADNSSWRYADMKCSVVGKKPNVQVYGSDLKVNGKISTSITQANAGGGTIKAFGSWVEYGVFSTSTNSIASSGAGLRGGNASLLPDRKPWSKLTFSNFANPSSNPYGNYEPTLSTARAIFDDLTVTPGPLNTSVSGVYEVGSTDLGNINIDAAVKGRSLIIRGGDIRITGPIIVNNDNRASVEEISQIVILADNITIAGGVSTIDAWLLTRDGGSINTCNDVGVSDPLTVNICNNTLTVNGAVMTNHLYLRRTAGADAANPGAPAEVFRLGPDAQLWAYTYANRGDRAQTTYVTELPPRF